MKKRILLLVISIVIMFACCILAVNTFGNKSREWQVNNLKMSILMGGLADSTIWQDIDSDGIKEAFVYDDDDGLRIYDSIDGKNKKIFDEAEFLRNRSANQDNETYSDFIRYYKPSGSDDKQIMAFEKFLFGTANAFSGSQAFSFRESCREISEVSGYEYEDVDNDSEKELLVYSPDYYMMRIYDCCGDEVFLCAEGEGTAGYINVVDVQGTAWIVHSDTTHGGRQVYRFTRYNGIEAVDSFILKAEYYDSENIFHYDETATFSYRGEQITMEEFEELLQYYLGDPQHSNIL